MEEIFAEIKTVIQDIVVEYNKMEDIFDKYFESEHRTKDDYYRQKEATSLMQELSWVKGKLETIIEKSDTEAEDNYMTQKHLINNEFMQDYIKKDIIVDRISKRMKYLMVDSCAEDSGKYTAYRDILNLIEGK